MSKEKDIQDLKAMLSITESVLVLTGDTLDGEGQRLVDATKRMIELHEQHEGQIEDWPLLARIESWTLCMPKEFSDLEDDLKIVLEVLRDYQGMIGQTLDDDRMDARA